MLRFDFSFPCPQTRTVKVTREADVATSPPQGLCTVRTYVHKVALPVEMGCFVERLEVGFGRWGVGRFFGVGLNGKGLGRDWGT